MSTELNILGDTDLNRVFFDADYRLRFPIVDAEGVPIDVSGWAFSWTLRRKANTPDPPLIRKTSADGITVTGTYDVDPTANTQRVVVALSDKDTYDPDNDLLVREGTYVYGLKRTDDGSETVVAFGKLKLWRSAAWE
jgi:hypothetical protein